jgi:RHS repeat-associated protein
MPVEEVGYAQGTNTPYVSAMYLIGPRGPEYRRDVGHQSVSWYVYDGLGSVVEEVDPSGNITAARKYDVYGLVRSGQLGSSSQKYVGSLGHESDTNTGLIYMRARYMDPVLGRFLSEDPARHGNDWFLYCVENPINCIDSTELAGTALEVSYATAEEAILDEQGSSVARAVLGRAQEIVEILQDKYECLREAIEYGFDRQGNAGIVFRNNRNRRTLFRFVLQNDGQWLVKLTSDPTLTYYFGSHYFLASQIEQLNEVLSALL